MQKHSEQRTSEHTDKHDAAYVNGAHGIKAPLLRVIRLS
jgi:hypothetical protein